MLAQVGLKANVTTFEQATVENMFYRFENYDDLAIFVHGDTVKVDTASFYTSYIKRFEGNPKRNLSKEAEELGAKASAEFDAEKRNAMWEEFWKAVKDDAMYYSLYHQYSTYIADPELNIDPGINYYDHYNWSWK